MNAFVQQTESTRGLSGSQKHTTPQSGPSRVPAHSHGDIARRAYDIYLTSGRREGRCQQNWQQAEKDLGHESEPACATQTCGCGTSPESHDKLTPVMKTVGGDSPANQPGGHPARGVRHPVSAHGHASSV